MVTGVIGTNWVIFLGPAMPRLFFGTLPHLFQKLQDLPVRRRPMEGAAMENAE